MICFLIISFLAAVSALPYNGPCPYVTLVENFNVTGYLGKWYELFLTPAPLTGYACVEYEAILEGDIIKLNGNFVSNGHRINAERTVRPIDVDINGTKTHQDLASVLLSATNLIATDYTSYAIEYLCYYDNLTDTHAYQSFIGSRSLIIQDEVKSKINDFFKTKLVDLDLSKFTQVNFSEEDCKYTTSENIVYPSSNDVIVNNRVVL